jgi:hypothetical protein
MVSSQETIVKNSNLKVEMKLLQALRNEKGAKSETKALGKTYR